MSTTRHDLGAVSAYALAVEHGYTGTEEEFATILANAANYASESKNAKEGAEKAAAEAKGYKDDAADILSDVNTAGSDQISAIQNEAAAQVSAAKEEIESKGKETLESIPDNYETLQADVSELKSDIDTLNQGGLNLKEDFIGQQVNEWLDEHPEATTTVQDGSLGTEKFTEYAKKKIVKDYVTPQMYGAVGDGITDDTEAILACFAENYNIFVPRGNYLLTQPIVINKEGMCINGENNMSWQKTSFIFDGCDGIIFETNRFTTFSGVSVVAKSKANENCGFKFIGNNTHKVRIENLMVGKFKYAFTDCISDNGSFSTLWNCTFKHIRTDNTEFALYFNQTEASYANNNFGCIFEDFYSNNGKVFVNASKLTFIGCNFGIRQNNFLNMKYGCYCNFINCNFECDEVITTGYCLNFNGKNFNFENCQFILRGNEGVYFINTESDLSLMKLSGCYSNVIGSGKIWATVGSDFKKAGAIIFDNDNYEMEKPNFTGSYYKNGYTSEKGLINSYDNSKEKVSSDTLYYSLDRNRVEYKNKSGAFVDALGNEVSNFGKYPFMIANGFYLDAGSLSASDNTVTVDYNRKKDGIFLTPSAIYASDGTPVMVCRSQETDYHNKNNYAVLRLKMWNGTTWVNNTKSVVIKWVKISR